MVQFYGARGGEQDLKSRNVIEGEAKQFQPIAEPIAGHNAESRDLIETRAEFPITDGVVQIVRYTTDRAIGQAGARRPRNLRERQIACREQRADLVNKN